MVLLLVVIAVSITSILGRYLLKRKFKPNEILLAEIKEIDKVKRFMTISSIIIVITCIGATFNDKFSSLLIIVLVIFELIRNKYMLEYINTKSENMATRKYILYDLGLQFFIAIVAIIFLKIYFW